MADDWFRVFVEKNAAYGDSFRKRGLLGVVIRMEDKVSRLANLLQFPLTAQGEETIEDTIQDLGIYAGIAYMLMEEDKLEGTTVDKMLGILSRRKYGNWCLYSISQLLHCVEHGHSSSALNIMNICWGGYCDRTGLHPD